MITLKETKEYLRVDGDEEDTLITSLIAAAESYLINATGRSFESSNNIARLFCLVLVVDWYENRTLGVGRAGEAVRPVLDSMLAQLNYCYEDDKTSN